jgi:hypothetical protein
LCPKYCHARFKKEFYINKGIMTVNNGTPAKFSFRPNAHKSVCTNVIPPLKTDTL